MAWHPVPGAEDLPAGTGMKASVDGSDLGVFHLDGAWWAIQDFCPHRGGSLGMGDIDDAGWVACPLHAWFFNVKTGECATSPIMAVKTFPCKNENGKVLVDLPAERNIP